MQRLTRLLGSGLIAAAAWLHAGPAAARLCGGVAFVCSTPRHTPPSAPTSPLLSLPAQPRPGAATAVARWTPEQLASLNDAPRPVIEAAVEALLDAGRPAEARRLLDPLTQGASDEQNCLYEAMILEADRRSGTLARASLRGRLQAQLRRLASSPESERCAVWSLEVGATAAAELQARAPADREAARLADEVYEELTVAARPGLRFARLPEALWPTPFALGFARGALAWTLGDWEGCGQRFVALDPAAPGDASIFAGRCYARHAERATAAPSLRGDFRSTPGDPPFRPLLPWEQAGLEAMDRAACLVDSERDLRLASARLLLSTGRPGEAAAELRALIERAEMGTRVEATGLFLEAAGRAAASGDDDCADEAEARRLEAWRDGCAGRASKGTCVLLERADGPIAQARASVLRRRAEGGALDASELNERAGKLLHDAARRCALDPIEHRDPSSCEHPEELLWSAAEAFAAGRLPLKSIRVRLLLLDPRYRLLRTEQARRSMVAVGRSFESLTDYEVAAGWYEKFAKEHPEDPDAPPALGRAVELRLALDQEIEAAGGAELLRAGPPARQASLAVAAALSLVRHHARRGAWEAASRRLGEAWRYVQEHGSTVDRIVAYTLRGAVRERLGLPAASDHRTALDLWTRAGKPADPAALEAIGEASLSELGPLSRRALTGKAPALRGQPERTALSRHLDGPVRLWLGQRRQAVEALEQAVDALATAEPALPPRWIAAARVRAFEGWLALENEASSPRWTGLPGLPPALRQPLDDLLEPVRERTTSAAWACFRGAVQAASFDESTEGCERWLAGHAGYRPVDESLMPRPLLGSSPFERPGPLMPRVNVP